MLCELTVEVSGRTMSMGAKVAALRSRKDTAQPGYGTKEVNAQTRCLTHWKSMAFPTCLEQREAQHTRNFLVVAGYGKQTAQGLVSAALEEDFVLQKSEGHSCPERLWQPMQLCLLRSRCTLLFSFHCKLHVTAAGDLCVQVVAEETNVFFF